MLPYLYEYDFKEIKNLYMLSGFLLLLFVIFPLARASLNLDFVISCYTLPRVGFMSDAEMLIPGTRTPVQVLVRHDTFVICCIICSL